MARPQPYRAARIKNRDKTITIRLRKSSSPSRWLMGLPPTSPRLKFIHTPPGGSPVPRRPPRHPPSPSTRSRSLELLDQDEKKSVLPVAEPEPLPRPRSRSLDGLLDEDSLVPEMKTESSKNNEKRDDIQKQEKVDVLLEGKTDELSLVHANVERTGNQISKGPNFVSQKILDLDDSSETKSNDDPNPLPVPRLKNVKTSVDGELKPVKDDTRVSSCSEASDKEENRPTRPPKPNRFASVPEQSTSKQNEKKYSRTQSENTQPCDSNVELITERLMMGNDKSMLLKAKSCGAGLDSDESISSNDYNKPNAKEQGSLLSLPTGAEPKRKKNFMDKCVNKVRSFMRK